MIAYSLTSKYPLGWNEVKKRCKSFPWRFTCLTPFISPPVGSPFPPLLFLPPTPSPFLVLLPSLPVLFCFITSSSLYFPFLPPLLYFLGSSLPLSLPFPLLLSLLISPLSSSFPRLPLTNPLSPPSVYYLRKEVSGNSTTEYGTLRLAKSRNDNNDR